MKRLLLLSALALFLSSSSWAYDFEVNGIYYNKSGSKATVTYETSSYNSYSGVVVIPETVTYNETTYRVTAIDDYAFGQCTGMTEVTIPNSVTEIGNYAFWYCTGLTQVSIPESVTWIGSSVFYQCSGLTSVTIPNSITSIGGTMFYSCRKLTSVNIPESVTGIGWSAFQNCTSLTEITLPKSVTVLGGSAFQNCSGLARITSLNPEPPSCGSNVFYGVPTSTCVLYVREGAKDSYSTASAWEDFLNIEEIVVLEPCDKPTITYAGGEIVFGCSTSGALFHYVITAQDATTGTDTEAGVSLTGAYDISVYAYADGYNNSETATATLYFIDDADGDDTGIYVPEKRAVVISVNGSYVSVSGLNDGESVALYDLSGVMLSTTTASGGTATLNAGNTNGVVIVKIGDKALKTTLR